MSSPRMFVDFSIFILQNLSLSYLQWRPHYCIQQPSSHPSSYSGVLQMPSTETDALFTFSHLIFTIKTMMKTML